MQETINSDGLARLINFQLARLNHTNRVDAALFIKGMVGAYDLEGQIIDKSLDAYFDSTANGASSH